ncbi:MAG: LVIVD repeat-containing protein [Actinomycetota bacterium]
MKRTLLSCCAALSLVVSGVPSVAAGPSAGGNSSDNVEWLKLVPFDAVTATGARLIGKYLYVTSWRNFSIYDVSDPLNPALQSTTPFGFEFENEDVSSNGNILLFSESLPRSILHVWDVENKSLPVEIATLNGAGDHTTTCILDCTWSYGSEGSVVDLRDPTNPKLVSDWHEAIGLTGGAHDVDEYKNGFLVVSTDSTPLLVLDVRKPLKPKVLASGAHPAPGSWIFHSGHWPNQGNDKFVLMEGEGTSGPFLTYDTTGWQKTKSLRLVDTFTVEGSTASSHWFDEHPDFRNGGLVVIGWYGEGTRFLNVSSRGRVKEVGWFEPHAQRSGFSAYWMSDDLVYAIDLYRGIDILRYNEEKG